MSSSHFSPHPSFDGEPPVVRLSTPKELVESIPHLLGFVPQDSAVVTLFSEHDSGGVLRTVGSLRVDLPDADDALPVWAANVLTPIVGRALASAATVVVWFSAESDGGVRPEDVRAGAPVLDAMSQALAQAGVRTFDALLVRGDRFVSSVGASMPPASFIGEQWESIGSSAVSAQLVVAGCVAPSGSRDAVAVRTEPCGQDIHDFDGANARIDGSRRLAAMRDAATVIDAVVDRALVEGIVDDVPPDDSLVLAAVALTRGLGRDHAVRRVLQLDGEDLHRVQKLWDRLVRSTPPTMRSAPAALSALTAYLRGDGASANIALDRGRTAIAVVRSEANDEAADDTAPAVLLGCLDVLIGDAMHPHEVRAMLSSLYLATRASAG